MEWLHPGVARQITDTGLTAWLASEPMTKGLTRLSLDGTRVTDTGVKELVRADTGLKGLAALWLDETQVTDAGRAAIKARFKGITLFD